MIEKKKRLEEIDILKALGIILMVVGHTGAPYTSFIFLFHMAIFFMASGFVYKSERSSTGRGLLLTIKSKILRLWLPYFLWTSVCFALNNLFITLNIYTDNPAITEFLVSIKTLNNFSFDYYMSFSETVSKIASAAAFTFLDGYNKMSGAMWFLETMFLVSVFYAIIDWLIIKIRHKDSLLIQGIIAFAFLLIGRYCRSLHFIAVGRAFSCYILFYLGYFLKQSDVFSLFKRKVHYLLVGGCSFTVLFFLKHMKSGIVIDLANDRYPNVFFLIIASLAGFGFLYSIAYYLKTTPLRKTMTVVGERTLGVMAFHFLFFKIVALIIIALYGFPIFCLAACPHLYGDWGFWWVAYSIVGVVGPVVLNGLYLKVKNKALSRFKGTTKAL